MRELYIQSLYCILETPARTGDMDSRESSVTREFRKSCGELSASKGFVMADNELRRAIELAKAGNKDQARQITQSVVEANPKNAQAWIVLAQLVESSEQSIECLRHAVTIDPSNERARRYLQKLEQTAQTDLDLFFAVPDTPSPPPPPAPPAPQPAVIQVVERPPEHRRQPWIGGCGCFLVLGGGGMLALLGSLSASSGAPPFLAPLGWIAAIAILVGVIVLVFALVTGNVKVFG